MGVSNSVVSLRAKSKESQSAPPPHLQSVPAASSFPVSLIESDGSVEREYGALEDSSDEQRCKKSSISSDPDLSAGHVGTDQGGGGSLTVPSDAWRLYRERQVARYTRILEAIERQIHIFEDCCVKITLRREEATREELALVCELYTGLGWEDCSFRQGFDWCWEIHMGYLPDEEPGADWQRAQLRTAVVQMLENGSLARLPKDNLQKNVSMAGEVSGAH